MKRLLSPTLQISLGLVSLTLSLILIAHSLGLMPNEDRTALELRAKISENLAIQLASLAGRNDAVAIKDTIASVISRNGDVVSVAIRGADGRLLVASDNHAIQWISPADGKSTPTQIQVPLLNGETSGGTIEIAFRPLPAAWNFLGLSPTLTRFICFMVGAGFPGFYFFLRRALRELDPSRAIPERVKAAFDTLAEGVLIMDERDYVVLANAAFARNFRGETLTGAKVDELPWVQPGSGSAAPELPWRTALHEADPVLGVALGLRLRSGEVRSLLVNATRIVDGAGAVRGLIATFDDVTVLHQTNQQLQHSIDQLSLSQLKISEQNQQLQVLASSDPLTGCLNRRSLFAEADHALQAARNRRQPLALMMLDVDHFKRINDRFGHVVGDEVLIGLVELLRGHCRALDLVGRYGGEEFCIVVPGLSEGDVEQSAERIRLAVASGVNWLPDRGRITVSIGIATLNAQRDTIADLVSRADEALYAAKTAGRNRIVNWNAMPIEAAALKPGPLAGLPLVQDRSASLVPDQSGAKPARDDAFGPR